MSRERPRLQESDFQQSEGQAHQAQADKGLLPDLSGGLASCPSSLKSPLGFRSCPEVPDRGFAIISPLDVGWLQPLMEQASKGAGSLETVSAHPEEAALGVTAGLDRPIY